MSQVVVRILSPGRQPLNLIVSEPLVVGREGDGLLLADNRVSRRHARLEPTANGQLRIIDLDSANGTIVDGARIVDEATIGVGEAAVIGDTRVEVITTPSTVAAKPTLVSGPETGTSIDRLAQEVSEMQSPGLVDVADEPGTLTIAFSDIEKSTEHTLAVGDKRWMNILSHHTDLMTRHVARRQGRVVRNLGDGFMMCFRSARQGVLAAIDMQRAIDKAGQADQELALNVRMGLHTGEVLQDNEGDLFGRHVQLAARIGDIAAGRQILVSGLLKQITEPRGDLVFGQEIQVQIDGLDRLQSMHSVEWNEKLFDAQARRG